MLDSILANRLELWGFEKGFMVFRDFSLGAGLKLEALDISCQSDDAINALKGSLRQFLNGLTPHLSIQIVQEIVPGNKSKLEAHMGRTSPEASKLAQEIVGERVKRFQSLDAEGQLPRQSLLLFVRKPFEHAPPKTKRFAFAQNHSSTDLKEAHLEAEVQSFRRLVDDIKSSLESLGVPTAELSDQEIFSGIYNVWNPGRQISAPAISTQDIRDQVCLTDVVIGTDHFLLGNSTHKIISLKSLPEEQTFSAMVETLKSLPFDSKLFFTVDVLDQNKEISSLQLQRRMAYASAVGKKGVADLEAQAKLADIEAILEEMIQGNEKVFKFSLNVLLRSENPIELDSQVSETLLRIREMNGAEGMVETVAGFDVFTELSPPHARARERAIKVNTSVLADLMPLYGSWKGHGTPSVLLRTREGALLTFDPFSSELTNSNMIVSGGSGAGKSYFANCLVSQMLKESPKVFILDIGGSYKRTCENLNGQYIELGIKSNLSINPFSTDGLDLSDSENMDRKIKFLVALVEIMTKEQGRHGLSRLEKAEVERFVKETLHEENEPTLSHLKSRLMNHPEAEMKKLGRILGLWCGDSPFGKFIDRPTTVKLNRDVVCFDLKGLDSHPELQSACFFLITDFIWREVLRDRVRTKFAIFDECWKMLEDEAVSNFIGEVFRTFRKYRASAIAISQTMDDFAKSRVARAIMPNSSIRWVLKQKGADQESLKAALQLNDREMQLISSLKSEKGRYSEALLMAEDKRQVVRIESVPLEYWLFTSDPADLGLIGDVKKSNSGLTDLDVLRMCALKYPSGAAGAKGTGGVG